AAWCCLRSSLPTDERSKLTRSRVRAATVRAAGTADGGLGGTADSCVSVAFGHSNDRDHPGIRVRHAMLFHPIFRCQAPDGVLVRGERGVDVRVAQRREDQIA